jgi:23S rRNA pseudouridine1911/1915/1917 synthase
MKFKINEEQRGARIDNFLAEHEELKLSRSQVQKLIREGHIKVNKKEIKTGYKLKLNDTIDLIIPSPKKLEVDSENLPINIVYEDSDLIVINKARGMVVHPGAGNYSGTLVNALLHHCKDLSGIGGVLRPGIVHRLDKDTTGLLVVAKNDFTHKALSQQFKDRDVKKVYIALVHGVMREDEGAIESKIGRHPVHRKKMAVITGFRPKSRDALTLYKVIGRGEKHTLVELEIKTGRTHQIRVHLSSINYPLVGDTTYGFKKNEYKRIGQQLHSKSLSFIHPRTGKEVKFEIDLPEDMQQLIKKLQVK